MAFFLAFHPLFYCVVDLQRSVTVAGEEQVLFVQKGEQVGGSAEIDFNSPGAVAVVRKQFVAGLDVIGGHVGSPPAGGHAHLRIGSLDIHIEGLCLEELPNIGRKLCDGLAVAVGALESKAVGAAPAYCRAAVVLPDGLPDGCPVAALGAGLVSQLGH